MKTGDHLKAMILAWTRESPNASCGCQEYVNRMNALGPRRCRKHIDAIVAKIRREARKRGWFPKIAANLPGAKYPIRQLVRTAIERAEADERQTKEAKGIA